MTLSPSPVIDPSGGLVNPYSSGGSLTLPIVQERPDRQFTPPDNLKYDEDVCSRLYFRMAGERTTQARLIESWAHVEDRLIKYKIVWGEISRGACLIDHHYPSSGGLGHGPHWVAEVWPSGCSGRCRVTSPGDGTDGSTARRLV